LSDGGASSAGSAIVALELLDAAAATFGSGSMRAAIPSTHASKEALTTRYLRENMMPCVAGVRSKSFVTS
jgi:hypothetical protein